MFRHIINRLSLCLLIVCIVFLAIGLIIEITMHELIFESYLGTFISYGLIFGFIFAKTTKVDTKYPEPELLKK